MQYSQNLNRKSYLTIINKNSKPKLIIDIKMKKYRNKTIINKQIYKNSKIIKK
jgi:hypothetical protein